MPNASGRDLKGHFQKIKDGEIQGTEVNRLTNPCRNSLQTIGQKGFRRIREVMAESDV